jgi:hypothetical protein
MSMLLFSIYIWRIARAWKSLLYVFITNVLLSQSNYYLTILEIIIPRGPRENNETHIYWLSQAEQVICDFNFVGKLQQQQIMNNDEYIN